jgi:DNA-directed RNA polymerase II subunit RPB2
VIEYVDKQEEMDLRVGMWPSDKGDYTHFELHPSLINGLCAALIPYPDHNQSPRNTYQSAMGKQAVGIPGLNFPMRMDAISHILLTPQKPLVTTRMDEILHTSEAPTGVNAIVCIMCWTGFNQEDSLIINREALQRGLFRTIKFQTHKDEERTNGADAEKFENPQLDQSCVGMRVGCYDKLQTNGLPTVGTCLNTGDAIIGKTITTTEIGEGARRAIKRDRSVMLKHAENTYVDAVMKSRNRDGTLLVKVRTRTTRVPVVGDKLSSRHGQKGVIGIVLDACDMPFTEEGVVPDIIVNPHAIPSRMTIGQLMEGLMGKLCAVSGCQGDATPFRGVSIDEISRELSKHGLDALGNEVMHNGMTGDRLPAKIFIGPTYYQRLKHMVHDKQHSRARGPVQILTRQPVEGRAREGGLRFGEMERDCFDETHQILTDRGFCFLAQLEQRRAAGEVVLIAAFDPLADEIVYEPMLELVVNRARERTLVHMRSDAPSGGDVGGVSLAVTEGHVMYYRAGKRRSASDRAAGVEWQSSSGEATGYREGTAGDMRRAGPDAFFRMRTAPARGVRADQNEARAVAHSPAFWALLGYWLGDEPSREASARAGTPALVFAAESTENASWLEAALGRDGVQSLRQAAGGSAHSRTLVVSDACWCSRFRNHISYTHAGSEGLSLTLRALDLERVRAFLHGFVHCTHTAEATAMCVTVNTASLRDLVVHLALHAGYVPHFAAETDVLADTPDGALLVAKQSWRITLTDARSEEGAGRPVLSASNLRDVRTRCRTWCVVVPRGFVVTRRAFVHPDTGEITSASTPVVVHNCIISHGAANVLSERLFEQSDPFVATVCNQCGLLAQPVADKTLLRQKKPYCRVCKTHSTVQDVRMPYAFKLLLQELMAMNIAARLRLRTGHSETRVHEAASVRPRNIAIHD